MRANINEVQAKIETTPGTAVSLDETDLLLRTREGDVWQFLVDLFETQEQQGSDSMRPNLPGFRSVDSTISWLLRGPASVSTRPAAGPMLRAAMFLEEDLWEQAIGSISGGPFQDGEEIVGGTSSERARVYSPTSATPIRYVMLTGGTFTASEILTGQDSGASASTTGARARNGTLYRPATSNFQAADSKHHLTMGFNRDGLKLVGRGMLANIQMEFQVGRTVFVTQRVVGGYETHLDEPVLKPASYPEESNAAPYFLATSLDIGGYSPTDIRNLQLNIEQNPEVRQDAQDDDGVLYADYQKDAPLIIVDPAQVPVSEKDWWADLKDGAIFPVTWKVGSTPGQIWEFSAFECQLNSVQAGAERTLATQPLEIRCNGNSRNNEIYIWQH